jgi:hypothetical protein
MFERPEQIEFIGFDNGFADCWIIGIDWGDNYETLTASDSPSHPQGVFSSNQGDFTVGLGQGKNWEDLPETLQKFLISYIKEGVEE